MNTPDDYDDGYGPPTMEDDAWYTHAVVSLGYPKLRRDPKPANGQMTILDVSPSGAWNFQHDGTGWRVLLGRGVWNLSSTLHPEPHMVCVEEPGYYRLVGTQWVRDENQEPEA